MICAIWIIIRHLSTSDTKIFDVEIWSAIIHEYLDIFDRIKIWQIIQLKVSSLTFHRLMTYFDTEWANLGF